MGNYPLLKKRVSKQQIQVEHSAQEVYHEAKKEATKSLPVQEFRKISYISVKLDSLYQKDELWNIERWPERRTDLTQIIDFLSLHNKLFNEDTTPFRSKISSEIKKIDKYTDDYFQSMDELREFRELQSSQLRELSYKKAEAEEAKCKLDWAMGREKEASSLMPDVDAYADYLWEHGIIEQNTGRIGKNEIERRHEYEEAKEIVEGTVQEINYLSKKISKLNRDYMPEVGTLRNTILELKTMLDILYLQNL